MRRPVLFLAAACAAALLLSGCAGPATGGTAADSSPLATPSPSPALVSPAPTATASAARLSIGALTVSTIDATGATIATTPYSDGAPAMVAFLSAAIGVAPTVARADPETGCSGAATTYSWAAGFLVNVPDTESPPLYTWTVQARSAQVGAAGVTVQSSTGLVVGTDVSASAANLPADQKIDEYNDGTGPLVFEVAGRNAEGKPYGGAALVGEGGVLSAIAAPAGLGQFYC
ncbi:MULTISPECIES: hypothetical protein [unclassified Cryobacterium]|uniref:hypothetical protein n=3 Tax=Cryobacterium TaxID=69578 RepID=UPI002AB3B19B|nr:MULTISPECIES: hypothetical protein [unclassified Cryobacterium]MDY7527034.1 hypothetical protein [Cryobacterium sp. 10C2]MEB0287040.1 hypothetical protein [Cryobacterium sp. 10S3]MEB0290180.1 hypothetical protein [Cryobacterium sp. 10C2]WPX14501.1 hypothetical protein RHM57_03785 [Cryobacterium sp. 10S3]